MNDELHNDDEEVLRPEEDIDLTDLLRDDPELRDLLGEDFAAAGEQPPEAPVPEAEPEWIPEEPVEELPESAAGEAAPAQPAPKKEKKEILNLRNQKVF